MKKFTKKLRIFILKVSIRIPFILSEKAFLKMKYKVNMGENLDLNNPTTFNEKLQWLKLYDRKPIYTQMVDKYEAKQIAADIIGEEHIIPTLGVWDSFDKIDFNTLPNQFVLKTTHGCGGIVICKNKSELNKNDAKKIIQKSFKRNHYVYEKEWPYKNVKRRIIAEKYMVDESGTELKDYKFFCFDSVPKFMFIVTGRPHNTRFDFFDMDFNHLPFTHGYPNSSKPTLKPASFEKMKEMATKLSKNLAHLRVDFYDINGHIYFGELTFSHHGGFVPFKPEIWDYKFGEMITLPEK